MEQYNIKGGNPLVGDVTISGAKNAALGILAASIMTDDDVLIDNLPDVRDINVMLEAIQEIGARVDRIDRHTVKINGSGIKEVSVDDEYIRRIRASYSVGATINIMMAAAMAEGQTILENAAKEPHIVDVANFLNSMGANIKGAGTDTIRIRGVGKLHGTEYSIIPDQIEAGTFMCAASGSYFCQAH